MDWEELYRKGETPWDRGAASPALRQYLEGHPFGGRALVPGAGRGHEVALAVECGLDAIGLDIAPTAVAEARALYPHLAERFVLGSLFDPPTELRGAFDVVLEHTCMSALHPTMRQDYKRGINLVLKPGGLLIGVWFINPDLDPGEEGPPFPFSVAELTNLFSEGYEILHDYVPEVAFDGREGRERLRVLRKVSSPSGKLADTEPSATLNAAAADVEHGRYEEALEKYRWLHDNILRIDPRLNGIRRYALGEWAQLGLKYPPALTALRELRSKYITKLFTGGGNSKCFGDIAQINEEIGELDQTAVLFSQLKSEKLAREVYDHAKEALLASGQFALARKYLGDPEQALSSSIDVLHQMTAIVTARSGREKEGRESCERFFTSDVVHIITVLDNTGDHDLALAIQAKALGVLDNAEIRSAVKK